MARRAFTVNMEANKQRLQEEADRLRADCARLQGELAAANDTLAKERTEYKDRRHKREKRHKEEVGKLKAHVNSLERQLKSSNRSLTECALKIEELHHEVRTIADGAVKKWLDSKESAAHNVEVGYIAYDLGKEEALMASEKILAELHPNLDLSSFEAKARELLVEDAETSKGTSAQKGEMSAPSPDAAAGSSAQVS